jgi:hypothetical protein
VAATPKGWTRTKRPDWHTATYRRDALCSQCERTEGETIAVEAWYDVYSRSWVVQTVDANGWDTGICEYWLDRSEVFAAGNRLAVCGRHGAIAA